MILHDDARPHTSTAARARALLEHFNWELFDHPPYNPDLAPSDCHLFTDLKN
jgi:transposase